MISKAEYWFFIERALGGMTAIVRDLGDDLANTRPAVPGWNTPFALLTHCLGVIDAWAGSFVAGRPLNRDRDAEFTAEGRVSDLLARAERVTERFYADVLASDTSAPLAAEPPADFEGPDRDLTCGAALQHVYEELAQHHGQMEQIRDLIVAVHSGALAVAK